MRQQVIAFALLGFWADHMYLVWSGTTTNETFKWADLADELKARKFAGCVRLQVDDVGEELHQPVVGHHAAIHPQGREIRGAVVADRLE